MRLSLRHTLLVVSVAFAFLGGRTSSQAQEITLTEVPYELIPPENSVRVSWAENVEATIHYGQVPGVYPSRLPLSGTRSLEFRPVDAGMSPGVYFCIVSNGLVSSTEFQIIVESQTAPGMVAPANNGIVTTAVPEFRWDPVPGVPYYHVIVSDKEAHIIEDANGELRLVDANIVWQAITPGTSIRYGESDPSDSFNDANGFSPPLVDNRFYNWVVLNNYGNNPAVSSIVQAGLSGFTTQFGMTTPAPALLQPASGAHLSDKTIRFQWQAAAGAHHYELYLFEFLEEESSESSYPVFKAATNETSIEVAARTVLKSGRYLWEVLAVDGSGRATSSPHRLFVYDATSSGVNITARTTEGQLLPRVTLDVQAVDGSQEVTSLLTTDSGVLTLPLQAGNYVLTARKEGFADTTKQFRVEPADTIPLNIALRRLAAAVQGQVQSEISEPIDGATVNSSSPDGQILAQTTSVDGAFTLHLSAGTWWIWAEKAGHTSSDTVQVVLGSANLTLPNPLVLGVPDGRITGTVATGGGQNLAGATVEATRQGYLLRTRTDQSGHFALQATAGQWSVRASKTGFVPTQPRLVTVESGQETRIDPPLVLSSQAVQLNGIVLSGDTGVPGARITATPASGSPLSSLSDARGNFTFSLDRSVYTLTVSKAGYLPAEPLLLDLSSVTGLDVLEFQLTPATATLRGRTISSNGEALAQVIVTAGNIADTSSFDGSFELALAPGQYVVGAQKTGYVPAQPLQIELGPGEIKTGIELGLAPQAGIIEGTVRTDGASVPGARIVALSGNDSVATLSGAFGRYSLSLQPGIWRLRCTKVGFATAERTNVAISGGQRLQSMDFNLTDNSGTVSGTVRDDRGQALAGARVIATGKNLSTLTDSQGNYTLKLSPGSYNLEASKSGYSTQSHTVSLSAGGHVNQSFSLASQGSVRGRVTQPGGIPIWAASVVAVTGTDTSVAYTDHTGEYELYLPGGSYTLTYDQLGYRSTSLAVQVSPGTSLHRDVSLTPDPAEISSIRGRIVSITGDPISGTHLSLRGHERRNVSSEADGSYYIDRLEAGNAFILTPTQRGRFFMPPERRYEPIQGNPSSQDFTGSLYGDVSANDRISSFDGSLILRVSAEQNVAPYYQDQPRDSISADVSGNGDVSPFDGSLIFRYSVGLIHQFPVDNAPEWLPKEREETPYIAKLLVTSVDPESLSAVLRIDGHSPFYSIEVALKYEPSALRLGAVKLSREDSTVHLAFTDRGRYVKIAVASVRPLRPGKFSIHVTFERRGSLAAPTLVLQHVLVDETRATVERSPDRGGRLRFIGASPNPFNSAVVLRFYLPGEQSSLRSVELTIFDVLGREVRRIPVQDALPGIHRVRWDGRDSKGHTVSSGIYFVQIGAGSERTTRKLVCVR